MFLPLFINYGLEVNDKYNWVWDNWDNGFEKLNYLLKDNMHF